MDIHAPKRRSIADIGLSVSGKRRDEPIHIRLRERTGRLNEEIRQEGRGVQ